MWGFNPIIVLKVGKKGGFFLTKKHVLRKKTEKSLKKLKKRKKSEKKTQKINGFLNCRPEPRSSAAGALKREKTTLDNYSNVKMGNLGFDAPVDGQR